MSGHTAVTLQKGLRLTPQQSTAVLSARRCLLDKLRKVGKERQQLLSALGLQLLQTPQSKWAQSPPVQRLQHSLGLERAAVSAFLFSTVDEVRLLTDHKQCCILSCLHHEAVCQGALCSQRFVVTVTPFRHTCHATCHDSDDSEASCKVAHIVARPQMSILHAHNSGYQGIWS